MSHSKSSSRYDRQIILPEIGQAGQDAIAAASVLCIGAGGLGCPALLYLAAAGVGRIGIIDADIVDESNLQRQVLYTSDDIGKSKAQCAKARLEALNPEITIEAYDERLSAKNAEALFKNYDIIIDGTDNFKSKFLINDCAVKTGKPFVYGSILGFEGQVSVFNFNDGPCYRCLFPEPPTQNIPNCADAGVIGAVAGMIGTMQAVEAIKLIVRHEDLEPLAGKLMTIDSRTMRNSILTLEKNPDCPICSLAPEEIILHDAAVEEVAASQIDASQAVIIDVRESAELERGMIEGAEHYALSQILDGGAPSHIQRDEAVIVYCQKGIRSIKAAELLIEKHGYQNVQSVKGGYEAWGDLYSNNC